VYKRRFIALPPDSKIGFREVGAWDLPVGAILMKEFILEAIEGDETSRVVLETRFFLRATATRWRGYSYQWNEEGTEALLVGSAGKIDTYDVRTQDGEVRGHEHLFPGRTQCLQCHSARAGGVLGLQTPQMNRYMDYRPFGGRVDQQLRTLEHVGVFREALPLPAADLQRMPVPGDLSAPVEQRARAFLHANCSHCHNPNGSAVSSTLFVSWETPLSETNACMRIAPGDTDGSVLTQQMTLGNMPPIGTLIPDPRRRAVFEWVSSLTTCP
jgi:mono/diheme cytochrome c family protein